MIIKTSPLSLRGPNIKQPSKVLFKLAITSFYRT